MKKNTIKKPWIILAGVAAAFLVAVVLFYSLGKGGSTVTDERYVKGVDVSAYQGNIDRQVLKKQDIRFAFIKATEGSDHLDKKFTDNWDGAAEAGLPKGAYHFVTFNEGGKKQAEFFIKNVPAAESELPPVIDFELYGDYLNNPPPAATINPIIDEMVTAFSDHYGVKPLIYTNYNTYNTYLKNRHTDIPIWICDISDAEPSLQGKHEWKFWQYSQRQILAGYDGSEKFIDMNLYNGNLTEFEKEYK